MFNNWACRRGLPVPMRALSGKLSRALSTGLFSPSALLGSACGKINASYIDARWGTAPNVSPSTSSVGKSFKL